MTGWKNWFDILKFHYQPCSTDICIFRGKHSIDYFGGIQGTILFSIGMRGNAYIFEQDAW